MPKEHLKMHPGRGLAPEIRISQKVVFYVHRATTFKTCLSKGTGSAFKEGELDKHGINSCVELKEYLRNPTEYLRNT